MSRTAEAMIAAKAKRNEHKRESVLEVIRQMVEEMDPALRNYSEIARRAGVHRNYVAGRFAAEIELAQMEVNRRYTTGTAYRHSISVASLRAERTMFKEQAHAQAKQLAHLRKRLGIELGREIAAEHLGLDQTPELVALRDTNEGLAARVTDLEIQLRDAQEDLEAARRTNKKLVRELNGARSDDSSRERSS
jgi:AraC-like DNA-binding protein